MIIKHTSLKLLSEMQRGGNEQKSGRVSDKEPALFPPPPPPFFPPCLPNHRPNMYHSFSSSTNFENQARDYDLPAATTITDAAVAESTIPPITASNKRILIVDDDHDIARFFKITLERAGYIVDVFNDPLASLSNYKTGVYDLLLLDIRMPQMSGFELYDKIKEIDDKVKVCFITAFEEHYDEFKKLFPHLDEFECYIRKPLGMQDLIGIVKSRLNYN
jgi:CheY-like chemotaxis protein